MHLKICFSIACEDIVRSDNSQDVFRKHIDKCVERAHSNSHFFHFYNFLMRCVNAFSDRKVEFSCSDFTFLVSIYALISVYRSEELNLQHTTRQHVTFFVKFCATLIHDFHSFNFNRQQIHHVFNERVLP